MKKGIVFIFFIFAIVFSGVAVGMFFGFIYPGYRDEKIAKTGALFIAQVTDVGSNTKINGVPYYNIYFEYKNNEDDFVTGKTNSAYTRNEAFRIYDEGFIEIKVDPSGRAVAADYKKLPEEWMFWIFVGAFGSVGAGMTIVVAVNILNAIKNKRVYDYGTLSTGTFISTAVGLTVNGYPYYYVKFNFQAANGQNIIQKTGANYSYVEVATLQSLGTFDIKYLGKRAIISKEFLKQNLISMASPASAPNYYDGVKGNDVSTKQKDNFMQLYNSVLTEIEQKTSEKEMFDVLEKYNRQLDNATYFRLKEDIKRIKKQKGL